MDFFEYAGIAQMFVNTDTRYVPFIVGGLCFLIVYVFQAVGLFIISGREGYKNRWMSFVPFFNTYYIGVCGQKNRVIKNVDTKIFSMIAAILEALLVVGYIVSYVADFKLIDEGYVEYVVEESTYGIKFSSYVLKPDVPISLAWAGWCFMYLDRYVLSFVELAFLVMQVFTLSAFFQTFAARRYMLFTITSILFPVQGILIFILRKNGGMNYRDFMRREQERQYRMYQQYSRQSFDQNPYNQNPYSRNPYDGESGGSGYGNNNGYGSGADSRGGEADDPFSEFGSGNDNRGGTNGGFNGGDPFEN